MEKSPKRLRFFLHFNLPASRQAKEARWSIHQGGVCHIVRDFILKATVRPRYRSKQPICVLAGRGIVVVDGDKAIIT